MPLVGRWPLNGTPNDISGNGFHMTPHNITYEDDECAFFNGRNAFFQHEDNPAFDLQHMTIRFRVFLKESAARCFFVEKGEPNTQYSVFIHTDGQARWRNYNSANVINELLIWYHSRIIARQWCDVMVVYNGATKFFYVDNVLAGSAAYTGTLATARGPLKFGRFNGSAYWMNGWMADVEIYSHALSEAERADLIATARPLPIPIQKIIHPNFPGLTRVPGMGYYTTTILGRVNPPNPNERGYIDGTTEEFGTPVGREVNLYLERHGRAPGNVSMPPHLLHVRRTFSHPVTGYWRFDHLHENLLYTVVATDSNGVYDPAMRSGLSVTPYADDFEEGGGDGGGDDGGDGGGDGGGE
jgi:hypothetical protein